MKQREDYIQISTHIERIVSIFAGMLGVSGNTFPTSMNIRSFFQRITIVAVLKAEEESVRYFLIQLRRDTLNSSSIHLHLTSSLTRESSGALIDKPSSLLRQSPILSMKNSCSLVKTRAIHRPGHLSSRDQFELRIQK